MTISVGDSLPQCTLTYVPYDPNLDPTACPAPVPYNLGKELKGKKAVIFAIPGAFTPTCSEQHAPAFLEKYDELKKAGVDVIICTAANDGFVMGAFGRHLGVKDKIIMASEGGSDFFQQLGLTLDLSSRGMGIRSKRFALVVDDLKITYVGVDEQGLDKSGPDAVLKSL
ncbi:Redoxin [Blakeslea trispora]|nr:Redoxin [Blakeslea trispora]